MCGVCGCGEKDAITAERNKSKAEHFDDGHWHNPHQHAAVHDDGNGPAHSPVADRGRLVQIEQDILSKNNHYAAQNRISFAQRGLLALNLVSSPGSGKTSLLIRTIQALKTELPMAVIEGDQQTENDAQKIRATGVPALQINTGKSCHLDAHQIGHAVETLQPADQGLLFIENVGNLVCPAGFDLGEAHKVVILSVTEGEDKPLKYPDMFHAADVMILNKIDLLPYIDFSVEQCLEYARRVNPQLRIMQLSARTGAGMAPWYQWLRDKQVLRAKDNRQARTSQAV